MKSRLLVDPPPDSRTRREALDRFRALLSTHAREEEWQKLFDDYPFIFSEAFPLKYDGLYRRIPLISGIPDYVFFRRTVGGPIGDYGVIELKKPDQSIIGSYSSKIITPSKHVTAAKMQTEQYLESIRRGEFVNPSDYFAAGNREHAFIVIGSSSEVIRKCESSFLQDRFAKLLPPNFHLFTYDELLTVLSADVPPLVQVLTDSTSVWVSRDFMLTWELGLHARPCAMIVRLAAMSVSKVEMTYKDQRVNAKSVLGLLTLAAEPGNKIEVRAKGRDSLDLLDAIGELIANDFYLRSGSDSAFRQADKLGRAFSAKSRKDLG